MWGFVYTFTKESSKSPSFLDAPLAAVKAGEIARRSLRRWEFLLLVGVEERKKEKQQHPHHHQTPAIEEAL